MEFLKLANFRAAAVREKTKFSRIAAPGGLRALHGARDPGMRPGVTPVVQIPMACALCGALSRLAHLGFECDSGKQAARCIIFNCVGMAT